MRAPAAFRSACADSPAPIHPRAGLPARCERLRMAAMATDKSTSLVLVVDDNPDATESLALILEIEGFRALTAHDGRSALDRVEQERPDAVLLDLGLPDLDGVEVGRRIRARRDGARILLVAISGHGGQDDIAATRAAGFDAHLVKPVDPHRIVELLSSRGAAAPDPGHAVC
jgi:CheY-like chemotaxis protein